MLSVRGKLVDSKGNPFDGHKISASFTEKVTIPVDGDTESIWKPSELVANVSSDGEFALELPNEDKVKEPILVEVLAPDGTILTSRSYSFDDLAQSLSVKVDAKTFFEISRSSVPALGKRVKLGGRVIDAAGKNQAANRQILLYARAKGAPAEEFDIVLATRTDKQGYFSGDYPFGEFAEAYGIASVGKNEKVPIPLDDKGSFPISIILVTEIPDEEKAGEECLCQSEPPRAPDAVDLTTSSATYSTDLGGGRCVDFTAPNRTLEEFSFYIIVRTTDPEIKGLTLSEPTTIPPALLRSFTFAGGSSDTRRRSVPRARTTPRATVPSSEIAETIRPVSASILKVLAADPNGFTPTNLMSASRYSAFSTISAALQIMSKTVPGRDFLTAKNPVDWDDTPTFYEASTIAHGHILHFKQVWKADGYSMGDLLYSLPLAPCQKKQIAVVDWDRREVAARAEALTEEERLAAMISRDRDISEIVNSSLNESLRGGSEATTWAAGGGLGLAIGPLVLGAAGGGGGASSSAWQDSARNLAASSLQQLRDRTTQAASSVRSQRATVIQTVKQGETMRVQTEVVANHNHCHAITIEYFEVLRHFQLLHELADVQECLFVPLLISRFDYAKALRWRGSLSLYLRDRSLRPGFDAIDRIQNNYVGSDLPLSRYSQEPLQYLDGELFIEFRLSRPKDKQDESIDEPNWVLYAPFLWLSPGALFNQFFAGRVQAERDRIFQEQIAPKIAEAFVQTLEFYLIDTGGASFRVTLDPTLVSSYAGSVPLYVSLRPNGPVPSVSRESITRFEIRATHDLPLDSRAVVHSGSVRYRTAHMSHFLFRDARMMNDLLPGDPVEVPTYPDKQELRNPREEDKEISRRLINHLNEHIEYYHRVIWWNMDKERRYMLLDGYLAPNSNGRSVASVVENRLIAIIGNCLVLPITPGFHLDPTIRMDLEKPLDLLNLYAPPTPIPSIRISVPTRGVFAESVMGSCNSCEMKDENRFWRYEEAPCGDEPTPILPVSSETRRAEPGDLRPTPFPTPMINLQNAPAAPDPTGLAAALQILGTPNIFRDVTGLTENQRNALAAFQSAMDTARFFGGQAANLALQSKMSRDVDKAMKTIQTARQSGMITDQQAQSLTEGAIRGMIGAGSTADRPSLTEVPQVQNAIERGSQRGETIQVQRGNETVQVRGGGEQSFDIRYDVELVPQLTGMSCWAAGAAMLVGWRDNVSIDPSEIAAGVGYWAQYKTGLAPEDTTMFRVWGLRPEPAQTYTVEGFKQLLEQYGPLWVASAEPGPHIRVVTGISGDGTPDGTTLYINDPWQRGMTAFSMPNTGSRYTETYRQFEAKQRALARTEMGVQGIYVAHL